MRGGYQAPHSKIAPRPPMLGEDAGSPQDWGVRGGQFSYHGVHPGACGSPSGGKGGLRVPVAWLKRMPAARSGYEVLAIAHP